MATIAFKMFLKPGNKQVYKQRHDEIWPDLRELLKKEGISNYYIFLDEDTNTLFALQDQAFDQSSQSLGANKIMQKWWDFMADIMRVNPDNSPVAVPLEQVFFME
ncbi:MAG: L-rhamnose 1-epimerase [Mucilaginibacter sp.]|nr:L-rhamnose 1-epimerase [Mucilaginibacter sp.]